MLSRQMNLLGIAYHLWQNLYWPLLSWDLLFRLQDCSENEWADQQHLQVGECNGSLPFDSTKLAFIELHKLVTLLPFDSDDNIQTKISISKATRSALGLTHALMIWDWRNFFTLFGKQPSLSCNHSIVILLVHLPLSDMSIVSGPQEVKCL